LQFIMYFLCVPSFALSMFVIKNSERLQEYED
jgi:hypothetical protein